MAHQHEDALSFWLTAFGEHLLVDSGRYLYDRKPGSIHSRLRSTAAHSTVMVDGQSQNARAHPVRWRRTRPGLPSVTARGDIVRLYGRFEEGYGENSIPVMHERTIESDMRSARWLAIDRLSGAGVHAVESRFQFAPGQGSLAGTRFGFRRGRVQLALDFPEGWRARVLEGSEEPWGGWFSPGINRLEAAPCLVLTAEVQLPVEISVEIHAVRNR